VPLAASKRMVEGEMHARDVPVLGDLIDATVIFATTLIRIGRHPFGFVHAISFDDPLAPRRAFKFIGAGIAFAYLIFSPALSKHNFEVSEFRFGIVVLLRLLLVTAIYHAAFFVVGYRRPITKSLILSSYINGVYFPFFMATMLPGYLAIGPRYYFEPLGQLTPAQVSALEHPLVLSAQALLLAGYPFFFALASYWWATAYGTRVWLSTALLVAAVILAGAANLYIIPLITRPFL
jgi:hypothetical protein